MKRLSMLLAFAVVLMFAFAPGALAQSAADGAAAQLLCADSSALVQAPAGDKVPGILEASTYPVCSWDICYDGGPVTTCRCPSGSCRAGKLAWCDNTWHPTCYCY